MKKVNYVLLLLVGLCLVQTAAAQNDVMMQGFYWDVPVDNANNNGTWWTNLKNKSTTLKNAGIKGIWVPSPAKGNFGIWDMGYGIYDLYDLGNYNQKGTVETRFGSRTELEQMISQFHTDGIDVYADIVLNHIYTGDSEDQVNPAVKQYVFDQAYRNSTQYSPYPTNEIKWVIKNAAPGDYYIQIHGYHLNNTAKAERGYDLQIDYAGGGFNSNWSWESEPNNGSGNFNTFPASGNTVRGHVEVNDFDEYKVTVSSTRDVIIRLTARREKTNPWVWDWADQTNGYYPKFIWYNSSNIATTTQLEAHTNTNVTYPNHTGTGEANFSWSYSDFHPVDNNDWLGYPGSDEIITNTKFFGNDLNTFSTTVKNRYKDWGVWLANQIGFDGFRLDFVRGFQESYVAEWVSNLPLKGGSQRFIVGEYWGSDYRIKNWVNAVATAGADVDGFDFPLKSTLTGMCNGDGSTWDMRWLNNAGMVRNSGGNSLPGTSVVTWLENHDTGKEHDKWITKDWKMGYAYILTHEGKPCIFYNHYFGDVMVDAHNSSLTVTPDSNLDEDLRKLMFARRTYLGGSLTVLSQSGNPYPSGDAYNVYVARRAGNGTKSGAIVVINNHDSQTKGLWVDAAPSGWASWSNTVLVNAFNTSETAQVYSDGRVYVSAPPRGYAVYVKQSEVVTYVDPGARMKNPDVGFRSENTEDSEPEFNVWSNPVKDKLKLMIATPRTEEVKLEFINVKGESVLQYNTVSNMNTEIDFSSYPRGMYILRASMGTFSRTRKIMKE